MSLSKALIAAAGNGLVTGGEVAEAVDFDGTNDYLSRSSDLTGNADGKTFTFSAWVWGWEAATNYTLYGSYNGTTAQFRVNINNDGIWVYGTNSAGTQILLAYSANPSLARPNTFNHVLVSFDLTSASNRYFYFNDVNITSGVTWSTYTNDSINFTNTTHTIGATGTPSLYLKGRLAHVYLDYVYRDLSVEANRRKFITADRKPAAGQASLNPILYLPMTSPETAFVNEGTGGDFTLNGVVARSGRGPNQFNAPYSDLDGAADYLSRTTAPTGIADGKAFTLHFITQLDNTGAPYWISWGTSTTMRFMVAMNSTKLRVEGFNAAGTLILRLTSAADIIVGRNYVIDISVDLANTSNRALYINGVADNATWATYTDDSIDFTVTTTPAYNIGKWIGGSAFTNGRLGEVFFHTSYIDLSVPDNLAKFVTGTGIDAKPVDLGANGELPLGVQPLIYLPMYGNNAGKNYGSGGDFTVNSGPYPGARGPNEYWGNKADFDGSTGYLYRSSALAGISDSNTISGSFWFNSDSPTSIDQFFYQYKTGVGTTMMAVEMVTGVVLRFRAKNDSNTTILSVSGSTVLGAGTSYFVQFCFDLSDTGKRYIYVNNVAETLSVSTYTDDTIPFSTIDVSGIGAYYNGLSWSNFHDGKLSEFYFTTDYIDFSQEANRLKFRDAFGNPVDLTPQIEAGTIPNPAIYMRFDPANQGKNYGTGGDFTVNGAITDAGQL